MKKSYDFTEKLEELKNSVIEAVSEEVERISAIAEMSDMADEPIALKRPIIFVDNMDGENQVICKVNFENTVDIEYLSETVRVLRFEELEIDMLIAILEEVEEMEI